MGEVKTLMEVYVPSKIVRIMDLLLRALLFRMEMGIMKIQMETGPITDMVAVYIVIIVILLYQIV